MQSAQITLKGAAFLCALSVLLGSCAKDADLLAEYVASPQTESLIVSNLVINDSYSMAQPTTIVLDVLSNDSFVDTDEVTIIKTSEPENGTVTINDDKTITYTPNSELNQNTDVDETTNAIVEVVVDSPDETTTDEPETSETIVVQEIEQPSITIVEEEPEEELKLQTPEEEPEDEEPVSSDSFTYTVESADEEGNITVQEGIVDIAFDYGELRAFPGAEGFGKYAVGGRGGRTIYVTNLNDEGEGSLRDAINQSGARTVVFKVSGYITINSSLIISNDKITIAGQTAPGEGITVRINPVGDIACLRIKASDVIIRGLRFRPGWTTPKAVNGDALLLTSGKRVIVDHCSFSWSTDEVLNPYGASELTFQNCIFSEALMYATHNYTTNPESSAYYRPHSMGMLIGESSSKITIYNSVFAHNNQRNPLIGGGISHGTEFELVNNVYYNWGDFGTVLSTGSESHINMINNLHIFGNDSRSTRYPIQLGDKVHVYAKGNINKFRENNSEPEINAFGAQKAPFNIQADQSSMTNSPYDYPMANTSLIEPSILLPMVTNAVGAFTKDKVDKRIVADIINGTGSLIDKPSDVGGYPSLQGGTAYTDSDDDGMSDEWEASHNLDAHNPDDAKEDFNSDGFTNLEDFLHYLAQTQDINLDA